MTNDLFNQQVMNEAFERNNREANRMFDEHVSTHNRMFYGHTRETSRGSVKNSNSNDTSISVQLFHENLNLLKHIFNTTKMPTDDLDFRFEYICAIYTTQYGKSIEADLKVKRADEKAHLKNLLIENYKKYKSNKRVEVKDFKYYLNCFVEILNSDEIGVETNIMLRIKKSLDRFLKLGYTLSDLNIRTEADLDGFVKCTVRTIVNSAVKTK